MEERIKESALIPSQSDLQVALRGVVSLWASATTSEGERRQDRRTAITRALKSGLTYRQVQMMSKHKDPKTVMRYDHGRENLDQNAVNFLGYDEE